MRILHVGKFYPPHPGGIERYLGDLAPAQCARGDDVAVLAHSPPGTWRGRRREVDGVSVTEAACWGQLLYAPVSPGFPLALQRAIAHFKPQVLHLHVPNTSAFAALALPAARALAWVVHWHADIPLDSTSTLLRLAYPLYRPLEQALLRRARRIVATSQVYADASTALAPWRSKIDVVPLGIRDALAIAPPPSWPAPGLRLLAVGRLSHYKGFDVLLRALAQVPDASLLLVGNGEMRSELHALAATLGIESRVRFAGRVDDDALLAAYAGAHAFCLPSLDRAEAFGVVLLEAMRAGLPIVASDIPGSGVGSVVTRDECALLVPPGDVDALAAALRRLAAEPALRSALAAAGRRRFSTTFSLSASAQALQQVYERALAPPAA